MSPIPRFDIFPKFVSLESLLADSRFGSRPIRSRFYAFDKIIKICAFIISNLIYYVLIYIKKNFSTSHSLIKEFFSNKLIPLKVIH
ncbi:Uncharacterised protein [uncultured archaeon]|nr:Uncharacterised protein [uncultured archaeon]